MKSEFGYTENPDESTTAYAIIHSPDKKLNVKFMRELQGWDTYIWSGYEITDLIRDSSQADNIKRILGYTFTYDEIEHIFSEIDKENPNEKVLRIRERDVTLKSDETIKVSY